MHLGEKTEDTSELNETSSPILVRKQRICQLKETSSPILVRKQRTCQINKTSPPILERKQRTCQLNETSPPTWVCEDDSRSGQEALQAEPFIDVPVGPAVFGSRKEIRVVHRDTNHFRVFAILRNAGNGQFDQDRLATMVKHVGMGEKGKIRHVAESECLWWMSARLLYSDGSRESIPIG
ncbi:hypothetical protein TNCV_2660061 [Trichonephila clavipes]|uniref:Uncharacterized protein n=1 Tax=Trichonephila clavipes TaxID=2585209 RepID=A0A8X6R5Q4_TRICX|nr:hypothetical protein TNCV_2660061 [Trichonephila clavipes]